MYVVNKCNWCWFVKVKLWDYFVTVISIQFNSIIKYISHIVLHLVSCWFFEERFCLYCVVRHFHGLELSSKLYTPIYPWTCVPLRPYTGGWFHKLFSAQLRSFKKLLKSTPGSTDFARTILEIFLTLIPFSHLKIIRRLPKGQEPIFWFAFPTDQL